MKRQGVPSDPVRLFCNSCKIVLSLLEFRRTCQNKYFINAKVKLYIIRAKKKIIIRYLVSLGHSFMTHSSDIFCFPDLFNKYRDIPNDYIEMKHFHESDKIKNDTFLSDFSAENHVYMYI